MPKAFSSVFLVYYEHVFVFCDAFIFTTSFLMFLFSILTDFTRLDLPLVLSTLTH